MVYKRRALDFLWMLVLAVFACSDDAKPQAAEDRVVPKDSGSTSDGGAASDDCQAVHSVEDADPCRCTSDCKEGAVCFTERPAITGGFCKRACGNSACADGYTCSQQKQCERNCNNTSECGRSRVCADGLCRPFCTRDSDCNFGVCNHWSGDCVASESEIKGAGLDEPCVIGNDCKSDWCSKSQGKCSSSCSVSLQGCPERAVCANSDADPKSDMGICYFRCDADESCARGSCISLPVPADTLVCSAPAFRGCMFSPGEANDGSPCGCDLDCASPTGCWDEANYGFPHGACDHSCDTSADCGASLACNIFGICAEECRSHQDCRPGYICGPNMACMPLCQSDSDCLNGTCDLYSGKCFAGREGAGIGGPCKSKEDCRSNYCYRTSDSTVGTCETLCSIAHQACPDSSVCRGDSSLGELGFCYPQ